MWPLSSCPTVRSRPCLLAAGLLAAASVLAQPTGGDLAHARSAYLQGERAEHGTDGLSVGLTLPWREWSRPLWGGELRGHWDIYLSHWSFGRTASAGYDSSLVLGVTPTLRLRPREGRSAWFWEAGLGGTLADHRYLKGQRSASTRFNFASHLGLGLSLGGLRQHELVLRLQHVSNAGIKEPNPGIEFLQLRYARHF